jgi:hypothetical protein
MEEVRFFTFLPAAALAAACRDEVFFGVEAAP